MIAADFLGDPKGTGLDMLSLLKIPIIVEKTEGAICI
jgi:hypothetical protein